MRTELPTVDALVRLSVGAVVVKAHRLGVRSVSNHPYRRDFERDHFVHDRINLGSVAAVTEVQL